MHKRLPHSLNWYPHSAADVARYFPAGRPGMAEGAPMVTLAVAPHAGWMYSGKVAGSVYAHLAGIDTAVVLGANHTGMGAAVSVYPGGDWSMPLGPVAVDEDFVRRITRNSRVILPDAQAHEREHAVEVQLPFLQVLNPAMRIVPIEMQRESVEDCLDVARAIQRTVRERLNENPRERFAVIASTNFTHCGRFYGQPAPEGVSAGEFARSQDRMALERVLNLDAPGLLEVMREKRISMCGAGPCAAVLECARLLGGSRAHLTLYKTSADAAGEGVEMAVGYAGVLIRPEN